MNNMSESLGTSFSEIAYKNPSREMQMQVVFLNQEQEMRDIAKKLFPVTQCSAFHQYLDKVASIKLQLKQVVISQHD